MTPPEAPSSPIGAERRSAEREKWDAYYATLPDVEEDFQTARFDAELVAGISALLPEGGRTLEAGCGAGWQSLALARTGRFEAALMDFAPQALAYASRIFRREGFEPRVIEADLSHEGSPEFDLVFNAGVLEHYTLEEQASLIRSMKSRATRYVLVLVPNRRCYWYWLWRHHRSVTNEWKWGKEIPADSLAEAFEAAGMRYIGQRYFGAAWSEAFISEFLRNSPAFRDEVIEIHRSEVIPPDQKAYLVGALGAIDRTHEPIPGWTSAGQWPSESAATLTAALADALALKAAVAPGTAGAASLVVNQVADSLARFNEQMELYRGEIQKRDDIIAHYQKQEAELLRQDSELLRQSAELLRQNAELLREVAERQSLTVRATRFLAGRFKRGS